MGAAEQLREVLLNVFPRKVTAEREFFELFCSVDGVGVRKALRAMVRPVKEVAVGIEEQDRERVFHSFTQVDGSLARRHEGAGLGLFISSQIVRLMGGRIHLESLPGKGSTFSFEIPFNAPVNGTLPSPDRSS